MSLYKITGDGRATRALSFLMHLVLSMDLTGGISDIWTTVTPFLTRTEVITVQHATHGIKIITFALIVVCIKTPALQHSGDVLDVQKSSGTHTIHVYLNNLGRNVQSLWFTLSGWTTTLDQIKQPYIRFTDADLDMELCRYNLGGTRDKHLYTCVIMCVLYRVTPSSNWKVKALGNVGQGRASNYNPIRMDIENLLRSGILK
eukprot:TRINITY_DN107_c0_g1_i7.p1 TRINITY_DN107_c0_g1~~TRINITY_DN107_c0_g1_i7.p1  ORF type:complete len:202 (+),score=26.10 TRINITY_DN107_c0_g1_i7:211-816(+)